MPAIYIEPTRIFAAPSLRIPVVTNRRSPRPNRVPQHAPDRAVERDGLAVIYVPRLTLRMHTSKVERLVRVDVPHSRDLLLIEKPGTSRRARAPQRREEVSSPVLGIEWLRTHARGAYLPFGLGEYFYGTEATCVVEDQQFAALESKSHRGVAGSIFAFGEGWEGEQPAGHAEIHRDDAVPVKLDQHVLAASADSIDAASLHTSNELGRRLPEDVVVNHLHATDAFSENHGSQASNDGLGLGEFRHPGSLTRAEW